MYPSVKRCIDLYNLVHIVDFVGALRGKNFVFLKDIEIICNYRPSIIIS